MLALALLSALLLDPVPRAALGQPSGSAPQVAGSDAAQAEELAANEALAHRLLETLASPKLEHAASLLDADALLDRAIAGLALDSAYQKGWKFGSRVGANLAWHQLLVNLADTHANSIAFVRVLGSSAGRSLLFRIRSVQEPDFSYLEFRTVREPDGAWKVADWLSHATGEAWSEGIRRGLLTSDAERKRPDPAQLAGVDRAYVEHAALVRELLGSIPKERRAETLERFSALPAELRAESALKLVELKLASLVGDTPRAEACYAALLERHPESITADLWAFQHSIWGENTARELESMRRLRAALGDDSQLDWLEAMVRLRRGELEQADALARRARASEPDWLEPYWLVVSVALRRHDPQAALAALLEIDRHFTVEWKDLSQIEEYQEFAASAQHAQWLEHLAGKRK